MNLNELNILVKNFINSILIPGLVALGLGFGIGYFSSEITPEKVIQIKVTDEILHTEDNTTVNNIK